MDFWRTHPRFNETWQLLRVSIISHQDPRSQPSSEAESCWAAFPVVRKNTTLDSTSLIDKQESMVDPVSEKVTLNGSEFCIHTWKPQQAMASTKLVVIFHGFLAHGLYPTVRYAAELLSKTCTVVAPDLSGHGQSSGTPGHLPGRAQLLADAVALVEYALSSHSVSNCILLGSSMGGTIALSVAQELQERPKGKGTISGVALLAPMLRLKVGGVEKQLLKHLTYVLPNKWNLIPSASTDAKKQYRDETKRKACMDDPYSVSKKHISLGSAWTCVDLTEQLQFSSVECPILVMVADEDVVVDKQGSLDLYEQAPSIDKTLKRYPALHGLLCEPSPLVDKIHGDLIEWVHSKL